MRFSTKWSENMILLGYWPFLPNPLKLDVVRPHVYHLNCLYYNNILVNASENLTSLTGLSGSRFEHRDLPWQKWIFFTIMQVLRMLLSLNFSLYIYVMYMGNIKNKKSALCSRNGRSLIAPEFNIISSKLVLILKCLSKIHINKSISS